MTIERFAERLKELMRLEQISRRSLSVKTGLQRKSILNWLEGKYYPRYDALIKLADFFNVSLDYLLGKDQLNDWRGTVNRCPIEEVPARFVNILNSFIEEKGYTKYRLAKLLGMGQTTLNRWFTNGCMPETATLLRLSLIVNESVDYLLGREY